MHSFLGDVTAEKSKKENLKEIGNLTLVETRWCASQNFDFKVGIVVGKRVDRALTFCKY